MALSTTSSTTVTPFEAISLRSLTSMVLQPKPTWPNPPISLGDELRPMRQRFKQKRRWSAIGPAAHAFLEICEKLQNLKEGRDDLVEIADKAWPLGWSFCMAGRTPGDAKPYIVVHCESKLCCVRIIKIVQDESWWKEFHDKYPSIGFVVDKTAPRPLYMGETSNLNMYLLWYCCHCKSGPYDASIYDSCVAGCGRPRCSSCEVLRQKGFDKISAETEERERQSLRMTFAFEGRQLIISESNQMNTSTARLSRRATIGGVLLVGPCLFGFTVAHTVSTSSIVSIPGQTYSNRKEECYDEVEFLSDSDESMEAEGLIAKNEFKGEIFSERLKCQAVDEIFKCDTTTEEQINASVQDAQREHENLRVSTQRSNTESGSSSLGAIMIDDTTLDEVSISSYDTNKKFDSRGLDWALIPLDTLIDCTCGPYELSKACDANNKSLRPKLSASKVAQTPFDQKEVFTITASTGKIRGRIDSTPFMVRPESSENFLKTYMIRLERDISPGDSGSWVVDDDGDLYGHIVAGQPGRSAAFLIPAAEVFADIETQLGRKVSLEPDYLPWLLKRGKSYFLPYYNFLQEYEAHEGEERSARLSWTSKTEFTSLRETVPAEESIWQENAEHETSLTRENFTLKREQNPSGPPLPIKSASSILNPAAKVYEKPEPQIVLKRPTAISTPNSPGDKSNKNYVYWFCHACGDGPKSFQIYVICVSCHHLRCEYCQIGYSK